MRELASARANIGWRRLLLAIVGVSTGVRLVVGFLTYGVQFDVHSYEIARGALNSSPFDFYSTTNLEDSVVGSRWPYPPGFFPWILVAGKLNSLTGLSFDGLIQTPAILADAAIALLVADLLSRRGATGRVCVAAGTLVALGPSFAVVSGYHGQIDSLAILPAVAALALWDRDIAERALIAGVLIGIGAAIKTVPIVMLIALLPSCRSVREAARLCLPALAIPLAALAPFAIADPDGVRAALGYAGGAGTGGISLLLQPEFAGYWLRDEAVEPSGVTRFLIDHGSLVTAGALIAVATFLLRVRADALRGATLVWLAVYVFGTGFFLHYMVWGLPFFLLAGYVGWTAALQVALLVPTVLRYAAPWESTAVVPLYVVIMLSVWIALIAAFVILARITFRDRPHPEGPSALHSLRTEGSGAR